MVAHRARMLKECEDLIRVELSHWGWLRRQTDEEHFESDRLAPFNEEQLARWRVDQGKKLSKSLVICHDLFSFNWTGVLALFCLRMS